MPAEDACNENEHSRNPYINKVLYLKKIQDKEIPYLVIADYNTTGMEFTENKQCAFNAGVRQMEQVIKEQDMPEVVMAWVKLLDL